MLFRFHRETLDEAMKTVVEVKDKLELATLLRKELWHPDYEQLYNDITFIHQGMDNRIGWDSYLVCVDGKAVGHSDGKF